MTPTETSTKAALVRRGYDAFGQGDMDTLREVLAGDVSWHTPGQGPQAGDFHGIEDVLASFGRLAQESAGTFQVAVDEITEGESSVVVLAHATAQREGRSLNERYAHIFSFRDDQVSEAWVVNYNQAEADAFWS